MASHHSTRTVRHATSELITDAQRAVAGANIRYTYTNEQLLAELRLAR